MRSNAGGSWIFRLNAKVLVVSVVGGEERRDRDVNWEIFVGRKGEP